MNISKSSLHYKVSSVFFDDTDDGCEYIRHLFFLFIIVIELCIFFPALMGQTILKLHFPSLLEHFWLITFMIQVVIGYLVTAFCGLFVFLYIWITDKSKESGTVEVVKTWYEAKKNNYCPKIEYKD